MSPIPLTLGASQAVKFYYDDKTKWVTDNVNTPIVVLAGNFQSELGCPSDFQSDCLRSWLQDKDGDGIYTLTTSALPPGAYETVVTINESFSETYGAGGVRSGANIPFTVSGSPVTFRYDNMTHVLQIDTGGTSVPVPEPASLALLWSGVAGLAFVRRRKRAR